MVRENMEKSKAYFEKKFKELQKESKADAAELSILIDKNTMTTQEGFSKIDRRLSALEIKEARREGAESVSKQVVVINWGKIILAVIGVATAALTIATMVIQAYISKGAS